MQTGGIWGQLHRVHAEVCTLLGVFLLNIWIWKEQTVTIITAVRTKSCSDGLKWSHNLLIYELPLCSTQKAESVQSSPVRFGPWLNVRQTFCPLYIHYSLYLLFYLQNHTTSVVGIMQMVSVYIPGRQGSCLVNPSYEATLLHLWTLHYHQWTGTMIHKISHAESSHHVSMRENLISHLHHHQEMKFI